MPCAQQSSRLGTLGCVVCTRSVCPVRTQQLRRGARGGILRVQARASRSSTRAGLDVGWYGTAAMQKVGFDTWELERNLPPGRFPFKFIMDGVWSYDADLQTVWDGENTNNVAEVAPRGMSAAELAARQRVMAPGGRLTEEEAARLREYLGVA